MLSNFCRQLLIDNFVPPEERDKLDARVQFDEKEEMYSLKPLSEALYESLPLFFLNKYYQKYSIVLLYSSSF